MPASPGPHDVRILGNGMVGRCMALLLAQQGLRVVLQAPEPAGAAPAPDLRAYALNAASVALLSRLRVWQALPTAARTPVHDMRVRGDVPGTALGFSAWQQRVAELAWIVDAAALDQALATAVQFAALVQQQAVPAPAPLTVIAEGKASAERERLGVRLSRRAYGHSALAARLVGEAPHAHTAHQWFTSPDVLALLPLDAAQPGQGWGLVWSQPADQAAHWQQAPVAEFEAALRERTGGELGALRLLGDGPGARAVWPLAVGQAEAWVGPGWALVGDAAHVIHPLAGQGLNLGLADAQALAEVIGARESWRGLHDPVMLGRYARRRRLATQAMLGTTDGLWQLFALDDPIARELRNRGLGLVNQLSPLKRWLTARALGA